MADILLPVIVHGSLIAYFWPWRSGDPEGAALLGSMMSPDGLLATWGLSQHLGGHLENLAPIGKMAIIAHGLHAHRPWQAASPGESPPPKLYGASPRALAVGGCLLRLGAVCVLYSAPLGYWVFNYTNWLVWVLLRRFRPIRPFRVPAGAGTSRVAG